MTKKVIIDLGAHKGEDSDYYLRKGFKVIAVEASAELCNALRERFKNHPDKESFTIFNYAITEQDDQVIAFYENENTVWGTVFESWDERNKKLGTNSTTKKVKTIRLDTLIMNELKEGETVHYIKIDIEGADVMAVRSLSNLKQIPKFISIESEKVSWQKLKEEFSLLKKLGYNKFKVIDQSNIQDQQCPHPALEGDYINHQFETGSTGLFGNELPGEWLSAEEALTMYKKIFTRYKYFGDFGLLNRDSFKKLLKLFRLQYPHVGWYDTHATY